jgi:hypothetical protein
MKRVDDGTYTHVRATYASEKPYLGGKYSEDECYIVDKKDDYCGDSVVTLARIGWADALARKRHKSSHNVDVFNGLLLTPIQKDLEDSIWLRERYNREGKNIANQYYFEYPSLISIMLREVKYGIDIRMDGIIIDPLEPSSSFHYEFGALRFVFNVFVCC